MDKNIAAYLLSSLLQRIDSNQIGTISQHERDAIAIAIRSLNGPDPAASGVSVPSPTSPEVALQSNGSGITEPKNDENVPATAVSEVKPAVVLNLNAIQHSEATDSHALLCLDFGTAMSKAFASLPPSEYIELALGREAGGEGYAVPSSVFIGEDGKAYFGFEAIEHSADLVEVGRGRLDSIKSWLSVSQGQNLDGESSKLPPELNPTNVKLTRGDLIRIYMAYLTDLSCNILSHYSIDRYVKRRYARPCWPTQEQVAWADKQMRAMLVESQILADTFSGQWRGGIDVALLKDAIEQIKKLDKKPDFLLDIGVPEPVAVAAGAIDQSENMRDAYMVVDVGAGTTDFGLFVHTQGENFDQSKLFQIPGSIHGVMQAGDRVDAMLLNLILNKEKVDSKDSAGSVIAADLRRKIRLLKETLFKTESLDYILSDGTSGRITLAEFLADEVVKRFALGVEKGFKEALDKVDETWLQWLAKEGVKLNVVLTGGSSRLPMMQSLATGYVEVKGHRIVRRASDAKPRWMDDAPEELNTVYPQLAVAIGGAAEVLPDELFGPNRFAGGVKTSYVATTAY